MAKGKSGKKKAKAGMGLNLILWLLFSLFAFVVVFVCVLLQNVLVGNNYREQMFEILQTAESRISAALDEERTAGVAETESAITDIAYDLGVSTYLIYWEERTVVSYYGPERSYQDFETLPELLSQSSEVRSLVADDEFACVSLVNFGGRACYLYLSVSASPLLEYESGFRWISIVTGLVAVVLAFVASGLVSGFITRAVSDVSANAKELARGNYQFNFRKDYFCSEINELSSALEYARVEISKAERMQRELIANISHDFKTPLTMIKAYASMIREITGEDREKRNANAQVIIDEADRLTALVSDVLDLSKVRAGVQDSAEAFNLSEETMGISARFEYLRETKGYSIEVSVENGLHIVGSRARIGQVIYNLISNAVNYTGEDKRVVVKLFKKENAARFEVIDTGKGIPPEELDTIWDRYYRSEKSHKRPVQGTGLGLSIVKGILLAHEVPFGVVSEVGKGSCFWAEFPLAGSGEKVQKKEKKEKERRE